MTAKLTGKGQSSFGQRKNVLRTKETGIDDRNFSWFLFTKGQPLAEVFLFKFFCHHYRMLQ